MAPKTEKFEDSNENDLMLTGFRHYPTDRNLPNKSPHTWLNGKRIDDDVGPYWRVHNKLYDLTDFIDKHPGGKDWLKTTKGTDITEAFESAHISTGAEKLLSKYYVKNISTPRNSPYTFHEDGFYKTFKRKVQPVLKKVGRGPSWSMVLIQDSIALTFALLLISAAATGSHMLAVIAGVLLTMTGFCAHNFFHQRDNWRMYYFDLTLFSSYDWRITHGLSHHLFTNTIYDYEISSVEPFLEFLPKRNKSTLQRYGCCIYEFFFISVLQYVEALKRICTILFGKQEIRPENLLPIMELLLMATIASSFSIASRLWLEMHLFCSASFIFVGLAVAHHHPDIYHAGDAMREDRDWGLCQLDAVRDRVEVTGNLFLVSTTFGDHALHHLLPTVDHSKLNYLYPVLLETCKEFGIPFRFMRQWDLFIGKYRQLANITPNVIPAGYRNE